ncbi:hypothetical protein CAOG_02482 [Capsaspora owczarzaki ATCC 30864]|uniref:hypothetical protein n=1 Tax=Capsaspora owczarzaki (strain ATCC 30864) TaxID=595528 RepID=UPI0001FE5E2F|nr:hypothetical protein CAOG_02482 [Capsaspora owczarzaki ATCC 30864]|eukprot:XP_004349232.1 hypothetical protein CAOG_02482 [Capsaspora owczarzaki ATCC 30864]
MIQLSAVASFRNLAKRADRGLYHGVRIGYGNQISHSHRKTRRRWLPNVHLRTPYLSLLDKHVRLNTTSKATRTIDLAGGIERYLLNLNPERVASKRGDELRAQLRQRAELIAEAMDAMGISSFHMLAASPTTSVTKPRGDLARRLTTTWMLEPELRSLTVLSVPMDRKTAAQATADYMSRTLAQEASGGNAAADAAAAAASSLSASAAATDRLESILSSSDATEGDLAAADAAAADDSVAAAAADSTSSASNDESSASDSGEAAAATRAARAKTSIAAMKNLIARLGERVPSLLSGKDAALMDAFRGLISEDLYKTLLADEVKKLRGLHANFLGKPLNDEDVQWLTSKKNKNAETFVALFTNLGNTIAAELLKRDSLKMRRRGFLGLFDQPLLCEVIQQRDIAFQIAGTIVARLAERIQVPDLKGQLDAVRAEAIAQFVEANPPIPLVSPFIHDEAEILIRNNLVRTLPDVATPESLQECLKTHYPTLLPILLSDGTRFVLTPSVTRLVEIQRLQQRRPLLATFATRQALNAPPLTLTEHGQKVVSAALAANSPANVNFAAANQLLADALTINESTSDSQDRADRAAAAETIWQNVSASFATEVQAGRVWAPEDRFYPAQLQQQLAADTATQAKAQTDAI